MGDVKLCHLYLAKSMQELNKKIEDIPKSSVKLLVNTAPKILKQAQLSDRTRDEEQAYVMYMRYFQVVKMIQKDSDYRDNKKYYDRFLDQKNMKKAIERAEEITESLQRRYDFANGALRAEKMEEERKALEEKEKEVKEKKKEIKSVPSPLSSLVTNGVAESESSITCHKLYSLVKEKCSTYLILDTRPHADFKESHISVANVINIPEEILKPGLTAGRISNELDESSQTLWVMQRHNAEYLVLVDWASEQPPLTPPLQVLCDAMIKWDPGKQYKGKPRLLQGGYELWSLTYPMHTTNQRPASQTTTTTITINTNNTSTVSILDFEYPSLDLNEAFVATPSPPITPHNAPSTTHSTHPDNNTRTNTLSPIQPQINRTLKPKVLDKDMMDTKNNNTIFTNNTVVSPQDDGRPRSSLGTNVNSWTSPLPPKESNIVLEQQRARQGTHVSEKVDNAPPSIPNRSLKPKEMLASLAAKKKELDEEQQLLEESIKIEEDTMKKMEEMEAASSQRELTNDEVSRTRIKETEDRLREEIRKLQGKSQELEDNCLRVEKQNEELWKMVKQLGSMSLGPAAPSPDHLPERRRQEQEQEQLQKQREQRKVMQEQVERMRRERKQKEQMLKEQAERERKVKEQKAREAEAERLKQEERRSRMDDAVRIMKNKGSGSSESYTTKLRGSPRGSPVRSNLRRSHSAFNLSQQDEEADTATAFTGAPLGPNFDRSLKPRVTPQRRNINAARQRNFEPKYGSVPPAKTGLKNLGNTCYMNSIIQCLNNTKPLVKYFLDGTYSNDINPSSKSDGDVAEEVGAVVRALWSGQFRSIAMWDLKNVVGRYHRPFYGCDQHDSHEFLLKLMDWLHDDLNKITGKKLPMKEQNHGNDPEYMAAAKVMEELRQRDQSILSDVFHGLHRSTIECGTCGHVSLTFEPFSVLSLSFPNNRKCSLRDLLDHYYKETNLEYKCEKCKKKRNCIRKTDMWNVPPVLVLHLNRFEHDVLMKKKQNFVDFPIENLDLTKYIRFNTRYTRFDLYGVNNHYGTMDGGHYTAFCRSPINNRTWYKFDDHEVYELNAVKTSAAYLLFYEAINSSPSINNII